MVEKMRGKDEEGSMETDKTVVGDRDPPRHMD